MQTANILIVDDNPANLHLLVKILTKPGYNVRPALNGYRALLTAQLEPPELILLDIKMPEITGYEVCQQLKTDERTRDIPVIFISALHGTFDKVKAFSLGAVDYITKPFQAEEVLARVQTHLNVQRLRQDLEEKNKILQGEIAERKRMAAELQEANQTLQNLLETLCRTQEQLIQSEKMAVLGRMIAGVAHELNTPVGIGITAASYFDQQTTELEHSYFAGQLKRSELEQYVKNARDSSRMILRNLQRTAEIVRQFKQVALYETVGEKHLFSVKTCIDEVLLSLQARMSQTPHTISVHCAHELEIYSDSKAFSQILTHLLINSFTHGFAEDEQGHISLTVTLEHDILQMLYEDDGKGMGNDERRKIFDPFYTTKRTQGSTGLGLYIIYNLVTQRLGGTIECESTPDKGTRFVLQISLNSGDYKSPTVEERGDAYD